MKSFTSRRFREMYAGLPKEIQLRANRAYHCLECGAFANALLRRLCGGEVDLNPQQVGEAVFQPYTVQQRVFSPRVKFSHEIDIGLRRHGRTARPGDVPRAHEPRERCSTPAERSSPSCSRNLAMIAALSLAKL